MPEFVIAPVADEANRCYDHTRTAYIEALRAADNRDYGPLVAFVRT